MPIYAYVLFLSYLFVYLIKEHAHTGKYSPSKASDRFRKCCLQKVLVWSYEKKFKDRTLLVCMFLWYWIQFVCLLYYVCCCYLLLLLLLLLLLQLLFCFDKMCVRKKTKSLRELFLKLQGFNLTKVSEYTWCFLRDKFNNKGSHRPVNFICKKTFLFLYKNFYCLRNSGSYLLLTYWIHKEKFLMLDRYLLK